MNTTTLICGAVVSMLLAACGGGGDAGVPPVIDGDVPASASTSPEAYSRYVGSVVADDRAEPLKVDKVRPPTSETAEPIDVI